MWSESDVILTNRKKMNTELINWSHKRPIHLYWIMNNNGLNNWNGLIYMGVFGFFSSILNWYNENRSTEYRTRDLHCPNLLRSLLSSWQMFPFYIRWYTNDKHYKRIPQQIPSHNCQIWHPISMNWTHILPDKNICFVFQRVVCATKYNSRKEIIRFIVELWMI